MSNPNFEDFLHQKPFGIPADMVDIVTLENVAGATIEGTVFTFTQRCFLEIADTDSAQLGDLYFTTQHESQDENDVMHDSPETMVEIVDPTTQASMVELIFGTDGKLEVFCPTESFEASKVLAILDRLEQSGNGGPAITAIATIIKNYTLEAISSGVDTFEPSSVQAAHRQSRIVGSLITSVVRSSRSPLVVQQQFGHAFNETSVAKIIKTSIYSADDQGDPLPTEPHMPVLRITLEDRKKSKIVEYIQRADGRRVVYAYDPRDEASLPPANQVAIDEVELNPDGTCALHPPKVAIELLLNKLFEASTPDDDEVSSLLS